MSYVIITLAIVLIAIVGIACGIAAYSTFNPSVELPASAEMFMFTVLSLTIYLVEGLMFILFVGGIIYAIKK